uniref:Uncharacterized protein n=1 Tax=Anguilla anguilla TaxID=7936 RepID=A0A0E9TTA2_ANGAN
MEWLVTCYALQTRRGASGSRAEFKTTVGKLTS